MVYLINFRRLLCSETLHTKELDKCDQLEIMNSFGTCEHDQLWSLISHQLWQLMSIAFRVLKALHILLPSHPD